MDLRIERLEKLAALLESGALSESEFAAEKVKVLAEEPRLVSVATEPQTVTRRRSPDQFSRSFGSSSPQENAHSDQSHTACEPKGSEIPERVGSAQIETGISASSNMLAANWSRWAKMLAMLAAGISLLLIIAQYGTAIAILIGLAGVGFHIYARAADNPRVKPVPFIAYGSAVAVYLVGAFANALIPRPTESELAQSQYDENCGGGNLYEQNCKGKFVIWQGKVLSIDEEFVRTDFDGIVSMDVWTEANIPLVEGQAIQVSGYLADKNILFPDIKDGQIVALESSEVAQSRIDQEKASEAAESARKEAKIAAVTEAYVGCVAQGNDYDTLPFCMQARGYSQSDYAALTNIMNGEIVR